MTIDDRIRVTTRCCSVPIPGGLGSIANVALRVPLPLHRWLRAQADLSGLAITEVILRHLERAWGRTPGAFPLCSLCDSPYGRPQGSCTSP